MCHSLKGACATVGALTLQRELEALEKELGDGTDASIVATHVRHMQNQLIQLVEQLDAALAITGAGNGR
jgi:HPt (histidine-containing phosphotransfer) domain-containing protein